MVRNIVQIKVRIKFVPIFVLKNVHPKNSTKISYPIEFSGYWTYDEEKEKCIIPKYEPGSVNTGKMYNKESKTLNDNIMSTPGYSYDMSGGIVTQYIDFNDNGWSGLCDKKTWANKNNIVWAGVSNYNNC